MDSTEKGQRIAKVNINMKIQALNTFFTEENDREMRVPVSFRREGKQLKEKQHSFAFLGQVNNLTPFHFHFRNYQLHNLIANSKKW